MEQYNNAKYWNSLVGKNMQLKEVGWPQWTEAYNKARYNFVGNKTIKVLQKYNTTAPPKKILEIGCGIGFWTNIISNLYPNAQYTGIDISAVAITNLQQQYAGNKNITFIKADVSTAKNPLPLQAYDLIICMEVLLHIVLQEPWQNALHNIFTSAAPNALVLISDPFTIWRNKLYNPLENHQLHTLQEYEQQIQKHSCSIITIQGRTFLLDNNFDFPLPILGAAWKLFFKFYNKLLSIPLEPLGKVLGLIATIHDTIFCKIFKKGFSTRLLIIRKKG